MAKKKAVEPSGSQAETLAPDESAEMVCANCGPILVTNTTRGDYVLRPGVMRACPLCAPLKTFGVPKNGLRAQALPA